MSKCENAITNRSAVNFRTHVSIYQAFWKIMLEYRGMMLINAIRLILMPVVLSGPILTSVLFPAYIGMVVSALRLIKYRSII